jgi:hypothetical protein
VEFPFHIFISMVSTSCKRPHVNISNRKYIDLKLVHYLYYLVLFAGRINIFNKILKNHYERLIGRQKVVIITLLIHKIDY